MTQVGVVITNFNYRRFLPECLDSVRQAAQGIDVKVVVVDDASTESQYLGSLSGLYDVEVLHLPKNRGPGIARNVGIAYLGDHYILPLDADDVLTREGLGSLCAAAAAHPEAGIVYGDSFERTSSTMHTRPSSRQWTREQLQQDNVTMYCCLMRTADLWRAGGYSDIAVAEDWELQLRLFAAGVRAVHIDEPVFFHRWHGGNKWAKDLQTHGRPWLLGELRRRSPTIFQEGA